MPQHTGYCDPSDSGFGDGELVDAVHEVAAHLGGADLLESGGFGGGEFADGPEGGGDDEADQGDGVAGEEGEVGMAAGE